MHITLKATRKPYKICYDTLASTEIAYSYYCFV